MRTRHLKTILAGAAVAIAAAVAPTTASAAGEQWIDGNISYNSGISCGGPLVGNYSEFQVGGYTGYWGKTDTSYPKIGDRYWGHVYYTAVGLGCGLGLHGVQVEIALPAGTQLAIVPSSTDPQDKIQCFGVSTQGQTSNLTDQPWQHPSNANIKGKYCQPTVTSQGANGTVLSYALVAQGQSLHIVFPLRSTKKLSGIAEPGNASRMTASISEPGITSPAQPYQWNFVGDRPVEPDCPAAGTTAASAITNTTAHTRNFMCNWFRTGKAGVELGEGATGPYQASTQQYNVGGGDAGFYVDQDWNNLTPGTTYHWRLKFVDDKGTPGSPADDQTYFSNPRTFTTTGTRPANPPSTTPGAGSGGTGSNPPGMDTTPGGGSDQMPTGNEMKMGEGQQGEQMQGEMMQMQQQQRPADTTRPTVTASVARLKLGDLLKKGLKATAECSEACMVEAKLQIDAKTAKKLKLGKKAVVIGQGSSMSPGGRLTVPVKLTSKAKKALKRAKSLKASLVLTATDPAGNASQPLTKKLSLKK
jgi:hypothetical protein